MRQLRNNDDNKYDGIEKYIDPSKLRAEFLPDIRPSDKGKILMVSDDLEGSWTAQKEINPGITPDLSVILKDIKELMVSIQDIKLDLDMKVDNEDFEGTVQSLELLTTTVEILAGRIEMAVEEAKILGAYVPGNNNIPTDFWRNIVNPLEGCFLRDFMFEQDSGWIGRATDEYRLMFEGRQRLDLENPLDTDGSLTQFNLDTYIRTYSGSGICTLMDGVYLRDADGDFGIDIDGITVRTRFKVTPDRVHHISLNINVPSDRADLYIDGVKIETTILKMESMSLPRTLRMFEDFDGEVYNFKFYRKNLLSKEILQNFNTGPNGSEFIYFYLVSCYEASKAECVYVDMDSVKASILVLKDEIRLTVERITTASGLSTISYKKVRYIRDYQTGNNMDDQHRWSEIQCFDSGDDDVLHEMIPTTTAVNHFELRSITDGDREGTFGTIYDTGEQYIEFDFGKVIEDLMYMKIWRYYLDGRTCHGTKTMISKDGKKWDTLFDSSITGEYEEQRGGFVIPINIGNYMDNLHYRIQRAEIKITEDAIISTVMDSSRFLSKMAEIDIRAGSIEMTVGEITEGTNMIPYSNCSLDISSHYFCSENVTIEHIDLSMNKDIDGNHLKVEGTGTLGLATPVLNGTLIKGDWYVFSFYFRSPNKGIVIDDIIIVDVSDENVTTEIVPMDIELVPSYTNDFHRVFIKIKPKKDHLMAMVYFGTKTKTKAVLEIRQCMFSKGEKLYPYEESDDDVRIQLAMITIKSNLIALGVYELAGIEQTGKNILYWTDFENDDVLGTKEKPNWISAHNLHITKDPVPAFKTENAMRMSFDQLYNEQYLELVGPYSYGIMAEKYYTLSVYAKSFNAGLCTLYLTNDVDDIEIGEFTCDKNIENRYYFSFKLEKPMIRFRLKVTKEIVPVGSRFKGDINILRPQLELGYRPTDYEPNTGDTNLRFKSAEIKITADAITQTVIDHDEFRTRYSTRIQTAQMIEDKVVEKVDNKLFESEIRQTKDMISQKVTALDEKVGSRMSSIEQTATSISSKVTQVDNNTKGLPGRMTSAEQKITSTAIINTVSERVNAGHPIKTSTMEFNKEKLICKFSNGAISSMGRDGFYFQRGGTKQEYHFLTATGMSWCPNQGVIQVALPAEFRHKNFKGMVATAQIGTGTDAHEDPRPVISFYAGIVKYVNNPSGRAPYFEIYGSTRLKNNNGTVATSGTKGIRVAWVVVA